MALPLPHVSQMFK